RHPPAPPFALPGRAFAISKWLEFLPVRAGLVIPYNEARRAPGGGPVSPRRPDRIAGGAALFNQQVRKPDAIGDRHDSLPAAMRRGTAATGTPRKFVFRERRETVVIKIIHGAWAPWNRGQASGRDAARLPLARRLPHRRTSSPDRRHG